MKKVLVITLACVFIMAVNTSAFLPKDRRYIFEYSFVVKDIPVYASNIRIWVPYPSENLCQRVEYIEPEESHSYAITYNKVYNNKMLYYSMSAQEGPEVRINERYKILRREFLNRPGSVFYRNSNHGKSEIERYLKPDRFVIVNDRVKGLASEITNGKNTTMEKARAIYDYIFRNISYGKSVPGWGKGDIERVCIVKSGNCTDFHSLFVALARASGIPAKFVMGVPVSREKYGKVNSYHCWAEFYEPHHGWIPVDISEASKNKSRYEYYFGGLDENRIEFSHGRDIKLEPPQNNGGLNYFIFPYVEVDGKTYENVEVEFKYREIS